MSAQPTGTDSSSQDRNSSATRRIELVTPNQAQSEVAAGAYFYDVRWPHRRAKDGAIPGAKPLDREAPVEALGELDKSDRIVLVCNSDEGSRAVAEQLVDNGFTNVAHVRGGFINWKNEGHPTSQPKSDDQQ